MRDEKYFNIFMRKIKRFLIDDEGSILPMIAVVLILSILLGAVNFALVIMYRDRAVVRNAIDAGVTSSLAAVAVEKNHYINYDERLRTIKSVAVPCGEKPIIVPRIQEWINTESNLKNYIQLDVSVADKVAKEYFNKNMNGNSLEFNIKSWDYKVTYDDKRIYDVEKRRGVSRPYFEKGKEPKRECDPGIPDVYSKVTNPEYWWKDDFTGANTGKWTPPPKWEWGYYERRRVIFPRWVRVDAIVTVELPVPFGSLIGRRTYRASIKTTAIKELVNAR